MKLSRMSQTTKCQENILLILIQISRASLFNTILKRAYFSFGKLSGFKVNDMTKLPPCSNSYLILLQDFKALCFKQCQVVWGPCPTLLCGYVAPPMLCGFKFHICSYSLYTMAQPLKFIGSTDIDSMEIQISSFSKKYIECKIVRLCVPS